MTETTEEIWKVIPGYSNYEASSWGRIRHLGRGNRKTRILTISITKAGYIKATVWSPEGRRYTTSAHRLVALAFLDNPEGKSTVNHKNGCKVDNRLENLEWTTMKENIRHAWMTGLSKAHPQSEYQKKRLAEVHIGSKRSPDTCKRISESKKGHIPSEEKKRKTAATMKGKHAGSKNPSAKLNETMVAEIKSLLTQGRHKDTIAQLYSVSWQTIHNISTGKSWKNVLTPETSNEI